VWKKGRSGQIRGAKLGGGSNLQDFLEDCPLVNPEDAKLVIETLGYSA
jgi:hypothetical protein